MNTDILQSAIVTALKEYDYKFYGLRVDDTKPVDGAEMSESYVYEDGVKTDELAGGISTIGIGHGVSVSSAVAHVKVYMALGRGWLTLVGGDSGMRGVDDGEVVIAHGIALESWNIK